MVAILQLAHILRRLSLLLRSLVKSYRRRRGQSEEVPESISQIVVGTQDFVQEEKQEQAQQDNTSKLSAHNEEQPISKLPYELLLQIFTSGTLPPHASRYPALIKKYCSTKRYLAQICHRWREIALGSPDMWCSAIDLASGGYWIGEVLRRSRDRPINVFMPAGTKEEHIAFVLHAHRVRGLYANLQDPYLASKVLSHVQELQELEELDLVTCKLSHYCLGEADGWQKSPTSENLPSGLRRLYLNGPSVQLPSCQMVTLTCLYVTHAWGSETPFQWLAAIRKFPKLQELSLFNCIKADGDSTIDPSIGTEPIPLPLLPTPIHLPHLRELELRGNHSACGAVFRGLTMPSSCVLRLETQDAAAGPTLDDIVEFLQLNKSQSTSTRSAPTRSLYLKVSSGQFYLQVSEEEVIKLRIHLKYMEWYQRRVDAAVSMVGRLLLAAHTKFHPQGGFETFTMSLSSHLSKNLQSDAWIYALVLPLSGMKEVQNLWLQGTTTAHELFRFLEGPGASSTPTASNGSEYILFPNLRQIALANVDIGEPQGIFIPISLTSFISKRPELKVARLQKCKHLLSLVGQLSVLDLDIVVMD